MGLAISPSGAVEWPPYRAEPWYGAYMEALFEPDPKRVPERIRVAEQLILRRAEQLISFRSELAERRALDTALHALHALETCVRG